MKGLVATLTLSSLILLGGCQATHTLQEPVIDGTQTLPPISVRVTGSIPGELIRNRMRRLGAFEQVRDGYDPDGYNLLVQARDDYPGKNNLPAQILSALTLSILPAPVSWNTQLDFQLSRGDEALASYPISNTSAHYDGMFVTPDNRGDNLRLAIDTFVSRAQADAALFRIRLPKTLHMPAPKTPLGISERTVVTAILQVRADGSVSDVQIKEQVAEDAAAAVITAVQQWRFEAWTPGPQRPPQQSLTRRFVMLPKADQNTLSQPLQQSCEQIVAEVDQFLLQDPQQPLSDVETFKMTSGLLFLAELSQQRPLSAENLISQRFIAALPWIVERCRADPGGEYQHYVAEGIRRGRLATRQR